PSVTQARREDVERCECKALGDRWDRRDEGSARACARRAPSGDGRRAKRRRARSTWHRRTS
ncbi:hypothetical protein BE221DRAFT_76374, partial [Ostreococcus tauri]